ncbi:MAG: thioredoxin [gamma proteobacterium symbiont of Bathyaustriella thionipta]|nr:thioredoxin [gamma proteobacterium symbiont of Bathyaustriella thionipta]MCU7950979.1 thioredoxin [gamma proteobacterium symbiont of Bathyaustriella thionipta]MCU7952099.1 thioredoxin [gamma proteobacterium symbiont of Bathyaustriella thionipta]MCU7957481.1 thioredoxin [gamma proteobacterium symbiont of Bathyaustriella thionipta]MCU7966553.1 thioredoxin [gamma proteobacterium symbiont of Bathyaustriella thionipta]
MDLHAHPDIHPQLGPKDFVVDATEQNFEHVAINESSKRLVLVDISADWCGPCNVLMPILDKLSKEYAGDFLLAKVDADENMRIAGRYKVRGFPTVIAFVEGAEVDRFHSAQREPFVVDFIEKHLF